MGKQELASQLAINENSAEEFKNKFMKTFRNLDLFIHECQEDCVRNGMIYTFLKRRRIIGNKANEMSEAKTKGARIAVNSKIQGSAADILRLALLRIEETILKDNLDAHLLLQLHDEVIYEVTSTEAPTVAKIIEYCMMNCTDLMVKLPVTIKIGKNWGQMENFQALG